MPERTQAEKLLATQLAVSLALVDSDTLNQAASLLLRGVCETAEWDLGAIWLVDEEKAVLRCQDIWVAPAVDAAEFVELTRTITFTTGIGLPGRVWSDGKPAWIPDVLKDANFPRARAAHAVGLHAAFGFPIIIRDTVYGVMEFFSREPRPPDNSLLQAMTDMGIKIGQFIERRQAETQRERLLKELQGAAGRIKVLSGLLPICASCKKIRDDKGYWNTLETYISDHSEADFSHGICQDCARKLYPGWDEFEQQPGS
jgi:GAF domain-containing protein